MRIFTSALVALGLVLTGAGAAGACATDYTPPAPPAQDISANCRSLVVDLAGYPSWPGSPDLNAVTITVDGVESVDTFAGVYFADTPLEPEWVTHTWSVQVVGWAGIGSVTESGTTQACVPEYPGDAVITSDPVDAVWACDDVETATSATVTTTPWEFDAETGLWDIPGTPTEVEVSGSRVLTDAEVFSCVGPQGPAGPTGLTGPAGPAGPAGPVGPAVYVAAAAATPVSASPAFTG